MLIPRTGRGGAGRGGACCASQSLQVLLFTLDLMTKRYPHLAVLININDRATPSRATPSLRIFVYYISPWGSLNERFWIFQHNASDLEAESTAARCWGCRRQPYKCVCLWYVRHTVGLMIYLEPRTPTSFGCRISVRIWGRPTAGPLPGPCRLHVMFI